MMKNQEVEASLSVMENFVLAALSTSTAVVLTNPLEVIKTRMQLQNELKQRGAKVYSNPIQALGTIARMESWRGLQRGLPMAMAYQVAVGGTRFALFDPAKRLWGVHHDRRKLSSTSYYHLRTFFAGISSGIVASVVGNPFYLIKTRLQAAESAANTKGRFVYRSSWQALRRIGQDEGVKGYFRGWGAAAPRVSLGSATQLCAYEAMKHCLLHSTSLKGFGFQNEDDIRLHALASLGASLVTVLAMNPFDVVSVRLYNQPLDPQTGKGLLYQGARHCVRQIYTTEGSLGFYKGSLAQYLRMGPHTVFTFILWEQFRRLYLKTYYDKPS